MRADRATPPAAETLAREIGAFAFFAMLAVALTWPLAANLRTAVADRGDPLLNAWILDWGCHSLTSNPLRMFDAPIFHPLRLSLALSEHMTGLALMLIPFHLAGVGAVTLHNIGLLLSFALSGYGAFVLARLVTESVVSSLLAGTFYAFVSFKFAHLSHVQVIASGWIPLVLAALLLFWRTGSARHAFLFGAAFVMNGLTNVYWLLFTSFAVAVSIVLLHVIGGPFHRKRLILMLTLSALTLLPFLLPYAVVSGRHRMQRTSAESRRASATWADWMAADPRNLLYGGMKSARPERALFPGAVLLLLAGAGTVSLMRSGTPVAAPLSPRSRLLLPIAVGLALSGLLLLRWQKSDVPFTLAVVFALASVQWKRIPRPEPWIAGAWVFIGFVGSFGENSFLHPFLFRLFEPLRATRAPARWAIIAYCGLALLAAIGASRLPRLRLRIMALALVVLEVVPRITWMHVPPEFPPVYRWLALRRPAAAIELPVGWNEEEAYRVLAASVHRVPIMNGVSGFEPPLHYMLRKLEYGEAMLDLIARAGAEVVIVHPAAAEKVQPWVRSGKLQEIARFPDGDVAYELVTINARAGRASHPDSGKQPSTVREVSARTPPS